MALPPIGYCESKSKMSAPGHIAIGTCARTGCNGCPSHFPFRKSSSHFIGAGACVQYSSLLNFQDVRSAVGQPLPVAGPRETAGGAPALQFLSLHAVCKPERDEDAEQNKIKRQMTEEAEVFAGVTEAATGDVEASGFRDNARDDEDRNEHGQNQQGAAIQQAENHGQAAKNFQPR